LGSGAVGRSGQVEARRLDFGPMLGPEFTCLSPFRSEIRAVFGPNLQALNAVGQDLGTMLDACRSDLGQMNRPGFQGLSVNGGPGRGRNDTIVEQFQGRFRDTAAAILERSHGWILNVSESCVLPEGRRDITRRPDCAGS
jgi:hypothetical protein